MPNDALLALYDTPDPLDPDRTTPGYDRDHARRTAAIVMEVAPLASVAPEWLERLEAAALMHDLGRVGMDPWLFGTIFRAVEDAGLPLRPSEFRERHPEVAVEDTLERFITLARPVLDARGIELTREVRDHIAMRMDYRGRLARALERHATTLWDLGVVVEPWMEKVILYYYYPHLMDGEPPDVRRMGMLLLASENFEAHNNARRGRDYYGRSGETMRHVLDGLTAFQVRGLVDADIVGALACTAASGALDPMVQEARGLPPDAPLPTEDRDMLQALCSDLGGPSPAGPSAGRVVAEHGWGSPVECPQCGVENPADGRFCNLCGASLSAACPNCAAGNPSQSRFCNRCGSVLGVGAPAASGGAASAAPEAPRQPSPCPRCHAVNDPGARHCYGCGLPLDERPVRQPEFVPMGGGLAGTPAGFWVRVVASVVDSVMLVALIAVIFSENYFASRDLSWMDLLAVILEGAYHTVAVAAWRTTVGKRLRGMYVVRADGSRVGVGRALARYLASFLSAALLFGGFLMVASRRDKRALHDLICDTRVVRARRVEATR